MKTWHVFLPRVAKTTMRRELRKRIQKGDDRAAANATIAAAGELLKAIKAKEIVVSVRADEDGVSASVAPYAGPE